MATLSYKTAAPVLDEAYVPFFGAFGATWDDAMVARWSANPLGICSGRGGCLGNGSWGHIVGTYDKDADPNNQRLYLNGARVAQMSDTCP